MQDFNNFEIITFDCYGTLIDWETGIINALRPLILKHNLTLNDNEILENYAVFESVIQGEGYKKYRQVLREIIIEFGNKFSFTPDEEDMEILPESLTDWQPFCDTVSSLQRLQTKYKLAVISNIDKDLFAHSQKLLKVEFDWVITAEDTGSYKPSHNNFEFALEKMGFPKEKVLHTAQSVFHDIVPANELGISNVWVNRNKYKKRKGATPSANSVPGAEITDLVSLVELAGLSSEEGQNLTRSAGAVVLNSSSEVLVVNQHGTSWSLPKGHIDPGEDNLTAARRETYEESGIDPDSLHYVKELGSYQRYRINRYGGEDDSELKTIFIYLFTTSQEHLGPVDPDNPEARWVKKEDVSSLLTHQSDKEFFMSVIDHIN